MSSSSSTTNDELLHLVEVKEIQGKGRALVSSQPLKAGQIILRDSPILVYSAISLKNGDFSKFCSHCYRVLQQSPSSSSSSSSSSCPSCSYHAIFCSSSCRTMALSSSHSPWVCQSLNSLRYSPRSLLSPDAQIQANFLIAAYNLALVSPSSFQLLLSLQGESPATTPNAQTLELHSLIASLSPPPQSSSSTKAGFFSPELTAALLAKDKQNAFGLMEPFQENGERTVRAYGIYPKVSFFNHDCLPNACRFDYVDAVGDQNNTDIIIRAIHDVPQGREICLSYFPVNWNYADRQRRLMEDYGFAAVATPWRALPRKVSKLYFAMRVIERFEQDEGRSPGESSIADLPSVLKLRKELCEAQSLNESHIPESLLERLLMGKKEHPPVCAIIGGILGQEVIKVISGKGDPLKNFFFFDAMDGKGIIEDISNSNTTTGS